MTHEGPPEISLAPERRTIDVVPDDERHGSPRSQFTLWFGANMQITAIVDGASQSSSAPTRCGPSWAC